VGLDVGHQLDPRGLRLLHAYVFCRAGLRITRDLCRYEIGIGVCAVIAKASGAKDKIADATNNPDLFILLFLFILLIDAGIVPSGSPA